MSNKKAKTVDRNILLLIVLFLLISLVIILGKFIFSAPSTLGGRDQAAISIERPNIERTNPNNNTIEITEAVEQIEEPVEENNPPPVEKVEVRLFFYKLSQDGYFTMKSILRSMDSQDLSIETIVAELLKGPAASEVDKDYMTFIPGESSLNYVKVISQTVRLDFSEEFSFNSVGYEGFNAQLKQIVYTLTELPQIDQVLFTINGELQDYINGEGMYTGQPLTRDSFKE